MNKPLLLSKFRILAFAVASAISFTATAEENPSLQEEVRQNMADAVRSTLDEVNWSYGRVSSPTPSVMTFEPVTLEHPSQEFKDKDVYLATQKDFNGRLRSLSLVTSDASVVKVLYGAEPVPGGNPWKKGSQKDEP